LWAAIYRSRGGRSAEVKEEKIPGIVIALSGYKSESSLKSKKQIY